MQKSSKDSGTSSDSSPGSDSSDEEDTTNVKKRAETLKASTAQSRSDDKGPKKLKNTTGKKASVVNDKNEKVPQMETAAAKGSSKKDSKAKNLEPTLPNSKPVGEKDASPSQTSKDEVKVSPMPRSKSKAKEKQKACSPVKNQEAETLTQEKEGKSNNKAAKVKKQVKRTIAGETTEEKRPALSSPVKESKKVKDVPSPSMSKEGEPEKKIESEKTSPNLSSTLVPTNNPLKKLKLQAELDCSPILKTVKDAFGSYFEKTMMDGEEVEPKKVKTQAESGAQEGQSAKKKKKKDKKGKKREIPGFL